MHIPPALFFPGSAETDIGSRGKLNGHLMAICVRNMCSKNYENWLTLFQMMRTKIWWFLYLTVWWMKCFF